MSRKGNKIFFFFVVILLSCEHTPTPIPISNVYVKENFNNTSTHYNTLVDSINLYVNENLKEFGAEYLYNWRIDSMICINTINDKLVAVILLSVGVFPNEVTDDATKVLGKKINGKWFFFKGGGTLTIPRSSYGKSGQDPLSFHELSQIARKDFLESALIKNEKGEYVVDDKWVDAHFTDLGWGKFNNVAQYDSVHWFYIMDKWKHKIDTNEYKPLKKAKGNV